MTSKFRCKLCKKNETPHCPYINKLHSEEYSPAMLRRHIQIMKHVTASCGCVSHSDAQSEQDNDCPVCGGKLMHHSWCIICDWNSHRSSKQGGEQG
jgi:hypothetical protein